MKKVKRFAAVAAVAMGASSAMAAPINFDPDGAGIDAPVQANQFDWLPGNALAVGGNQAVQNAILNQADGGNRDTSFTLLYQARMTAITNAANLNVTPPGLDYPGGPSANEYELTIVAAFQERVVQFVPGLNPGEGTAIFSDVGVPQTNNFLEVYFDNNPLTRANDLAGTGFNDGLRIAAGTVDIVNSNFTATDAIAPFNPLDQAGGTDNYPLIDTVDGIGVTGLKADISIPTVNTAFFIDNPQQLIFDIFTTTQTVPFGTIDPSSRFVFAPGGAAPVLAGAGLGVASLGSVNGLLPIGPGGGGQDVQFQADASNTFQQVPGVVPEPATAMLGLMGLAGLAFRRSRKA